jgi:predicted protein tyrosine phosphatase
MIRDIVVVPRIVIKDAIEKQYFIFKKSWHLISICTQPQEELVKETELIILKSLGCQELLTLFFGDYTLDKWNNIQDSLKSITPNTRLFDESDADKIIKFINKINEDIYGTLVIHCDAGISRSGAVGLFVCRYLGLDERKFRKMNSYIHPNPYILEILCKKSGLTEDYIKLWSGLLYQDGRYNG